MIHMLGASILMVFTIHFFSVNYTLSKINTAYYGLYKGVAENSVIVSDSEGNELASPVFSAALMKERVGAYFEVNVKPYCKYKLKYYFFKGTKPVADLASKASIAITFYPYGWHSYERVASFQITKGLNNNG